jgi:hypothetical protein
MGVALAGVAVVTAFLVAHGDRVREHIEAWRYLLSAETRAVLTRKLGGEASTSPLGSDRALRERLAARADRRVIIATHWRDGVYWGSISRGAPASNSSESELLASRGWRLVDLELPRAILADPPALSQIR